MSAPAAPMYAYPLRALRRWVGEQLRLQREPAGDIEAVFRVEGSTCGNVPMAMLYLVRLGTAEEGWPIRRLSICPAPHDEGHRYQCAYRASEAQLQADLQREQPCLGLPLPAALTWSPPASPAGCLCTEQSRAHKWRIIFHTLHFALTQPSIQSHPS